MYRQPGRIGLVGECARLPAGAHRSTSTAWGGRATMRERGYDNTRHHARQEGRKATVAPESVSRCGKRDIGRKMPCLLPRADLDAMLTGETTAEVWTCQSFTNALGRTARR
jgi:hypothetical protein